MNRAKFTSGVMWAGALAVVAAIGAALWLVTAPQPVTVQGEVTTDRVDISPRVSGRVAQLTVAVGDTVTAGSVLAVLDNPQLTTALEAAGAALAVAEADLARVNSIRPETVAARRADLAAADADVVLSNETFDRKAQLVRSGDAARQQYDEAARNLEAARRKRDAADAALRLAEAGASEAVHLLE